MKERKNDTILIVDDELLVRDLLATHLEREGYPVLTAVDGVEGLEIFYRSRPRIVILDLKMPNLSGVGVLEKIRPDIGMGWGCAVIVLTGYGTDEDIETCFRLGVHSFIRKPVNLFEILGVVERNCRLLAYEEQLETALAEQKSANQLIKNTLEAVAEGVVVLDEALRIRLISESGCRVLDMSRHRIVGKKAAGILGKKIAGPSSLLAECIQHRRNADETSCHLLTPSGKSIPVTLSIRSFEGKPDETGWLLLFQDRRDQEKRLRNDMGGYRFGEMISKAPEMEKLFNMVDQVAPSNATVLITGESGSGKDLLAREIHTRSRRAQKPFLAVNCAAIPINLLESEFFGHEKGAFTGATQRKKGRFEMADQGTLFLDEIAELPLELQGKLLRAIEQMTFERVGGTDTIRVDVRILAATHQDLGGLVAAGRFRQDLYFRLDVVTVHLPPLKNRLEDIPLLVGEYIRKSRGQNVRPIESVAPEAMQVLLNYGWPGNVRELFNALEHAAAMVTDGIIRRSHLPVKISSLNPQPVRRLSKAERERTEIMAALDRADDDRKRAAGLLGVSLSTLYRKIKKYEIGDRKGPAA